MNTTTTTNIRTFIVKYVPFTEKKPARVLINDLRLKQSTFISYNDSEYSHIQDIAKDYLEKRGIKIEMQSEGKGYIMLHTNDFKTAIK